MVLDLENSSSTFISGWCRRSRNFNSLSGEARASGTSSYWWHLSGSWGSTSITLVSGFSSRPFQFLLQSECLPLKVKAMHFRLDRPNESTKLLSVHVVQDLKCSTDPGFGKTKNVFISEQERLLHSHLLGLDLQIRNWHIDIYFKLNRVKYVLISEQNPKRSLATVFYSVLILSQWLWLRVV